MQSVVHALTRKAFVAGAVAVCLAGWALIAPQPASAQKPAPAVAASGPVSPQEMERRLAERAALLNKENPAGADRIVAYELAWPKTEEEYKALGKNALLLVSAVVRSREEFPLKRAYAVSGEKAVNFRKLWSKRLETPKGSLMRHMFGAWREDVMYVVPIHLLSGDGALYVDFNKGRDRFKINEGPLTPPDFIKADTDHRAGSASAAAISKFIAREFPGYTRVGGSGRRARGKKRQ